MCNGGGFRVNSSLYMQTMVTAYDDAADRIPTLVPEDKFILVTGTVEVIEVLDRDGNSMVPEWWALRAGGQILLGVHGSREAALTAARTLLGVVTIGEAPES